MSLAVGVVSSSKSMGFDDEDKQEQSPESSNTHSVVDPAVEQEAVEKIGRRMSESSLYTTEDEEEEDNEGSIQLGPQFTLKELQEKDKDDASLARWKDGLLAGVDIDSLGEGLDPEVTIISLAIKSPGRPDVCLAIPEAGNPKGTWFTLKEGSRYSLDFTFMVRNNIVSGLKYTNTVWKSGIKVDSTKQMIGTFCPQLEAYTHEMPEETTPSGMFARGSYTARSKFLDDDSKCYLEITYTFDIKKDWPSKC